jgi:hypothetical protein
MRTRAYRSSGGIPAFPARWFTAYTCSSRRPGVLVTVVRDRRWPLTNLTPALGRQNHTTSPSASAPSSVAHSASTASHRAFVTCARPSDRVRQPSYSGDLGCRSRKFRRIRNLQPSTYSTPKPKCAFEGRTSQLRARTKPKGNLAFHPTGIWERKGRRQCASDRSRIMPASHDLGH